MRASSGSNSTSGSEGAAQRRYMTSAGHCLAKLLGVSRDAVVYCPAQTHQRSVYLNNVDCHCGDQCAWASSGCFLNNVGCPSLHGGTASSETSCILLMYALDHCTGSAAADHCIDPNRRPAQCAHTGSLLQTHFWVGTALVQSASQLSSAKPQVGR